MRISSITLFKNINSYYNTQYDACDVGVATDHLEIGFYSGS
jgi:hypothetical protein